MSNDPDEPDYRVYRGGGSTHAGRRRRPSRPADAEPSPPSRGERATPPRSGTPRSAQTPRATRESDRRAAGRDPDAPEYTVYRSQPRGMGARLRGTTDSELGSRLEESERDGARRNEAARARAAERGGTGHLRGERRGRSRWGRGTWSIWRAVKYVVCLIIAWVVLSAVLFVVSASEKAGNIPKSLSAALTKTSSPMLFSAQNVLVIGLDNRPSSGYSSKEGGLTASQRSEASANTDTLMLWRIGGGVSRKLSIPRDTLVNVPGLGPAKINAAWGYGSDGNGTTVKVVEALTGVTINHVIIVDLGNFPKFIDDIGGVTVTTPQICSSISGGAAQGGYTLNLSPGTHHLDGVNALTYARTRENTCNLAYNDINREKAQQQILNGIRSQLFSAHAFLHLPWVAWDAPGVVQTDMGAATLLQMFASSEVGGNSKAETLQESSGTSAGEDVLIPNSADVHAKVQQLLTGQ